MDRFRERLGPRHGHRENSQRKTVKEEARCRESNAFDAAGAFYIIWYAMTEHKNVLVLSPVCQGAHLTDDSVNAPAGIAKNFHHHPVGYTGYQAVGVLDKT